MPSRSRRSWSAKSSSADGPGGFSLLEVLVAVAVVGIGLGVVLEGVGQGLRLRRGAGESLQLAAVAEELVERVRSMKEAPGSGEAGEAEGLSWAIEPRGAVDGPRRGQELVEVRLSVVAPSGARWEAATLLPAASGGKP